MTHVALSRLIRISTLIAFLASFFSNSYSLPIAEAATYPVGTSITVPITVSSTLPFLGVEFTVFVQGGELESLTCGGTDFTVVSSQSNGCVLVRTGLGLTQATVATVKAKATTPGTLTVGAQGTVTGALNNQILGQYVGATHTITGPTPTPTTTPTPIITNTIIVIPTPTSTSTTTTTNSSTTTSTSSNQKSTSSSPSGTSQTSDSSTSSQASSGNTGSNSRTTTNTGTTSGSDILIIDQPVAKEGEATATSAINTILFKKGALDVAEKPVTISLPDNKDTPIELDFTELLATDNDSNSVTIPQAVHFTDPNGIIVILPAGLTIQPDREKCALPNWDGTMMAPTVYQNPSLPTGALMQYADLAITVGKQNCQIALDAPVQLLIPNHAGWSVGYRSNANDNVSLIKAECVSNTSNTLPANRDECFLNKGSDLLIVTKHFTEFVLFKSNYTMAWVIVSGILIIGAIIGGIIWYYQQKINKLNKIASLNRNYRLE